MKIRLVVELEYEADPNHYPGAKTAEQMAQMDIANIENGEASLMDFEDDIVSITFVPTGGG